MTSTLARTLDAPCKDTLEGDWRVERLSGLLPPTGVGKSIRGCQGTTTLAGSPIADFAVIGTTLAYAHLPIHDELVPISEGLWHGTGRVLRVAFCTFRLVKQP
jgi:hypothetical protein